MRNRNMGISDKYQRGIAIRRQLGAALYYPLFDGIGTLNPSPAIGTLPATGVGGVGFGTSQHPWLPNMNASAKFDGISSYINLTQSVGSEYITSAFVAGGFSMEAWFRTSQIDGSNRHITMVGSGTADRSTRWYISAAGRMVLRIGSKSWSYEVDWPQSPYVCDGKWHHIITTISPTTLYGTAKTYIDGVKLLEVANHLCWANLPWNLFTVGSTNTGANLFRGDICHVGIYQRELTADGVQYLYKLGTSLDIRGRPWFGQRM